MLNDDEVGEDALLGESRPEVELDLDMAERCWSEGACWPLRNRSSSALSRAFSERRASSSLRRLFSSMSRWVFGSSELSRGVGGRSPIGGGGRIGRDDLSFDLPVDDVRWELLAELADGFRSRVKSLRYPGWEK